MVGEAPKSEQDQVSILTQSVEIDNNNNNVTVILKLE
jgi:hypothetical protein